MSVNSVFLTYLGCGHDRIGNRLPRTNNDHTLQITTLLGQCPNCRRHDRSRMRTGHDPTASNELNDANQEVSFLSLNVGGSFSPSPVPDMQPAHVSANTPDQPVSGNLSDVPSPSSEYWVTVTPSTDTDSETTTHIQQDYNAIITISRQMNSSKNRASRKRKSPSSTSSSGFTTVSADSDSDLVEVQKKKQRTDNIPRSHPHPGQNHRRSRDDQNSGVTESRNAKANRSGRRWYGHSKNHRGSSTSQAGPSSQPSNSNTPSSSSSIKDKMYSFESTDEEERHKLKLHRFIQDLVVEFEPNVYENCGVDLDSLQDLDKSIEFHKKKLKEYAAALRAEKYRSEPI